MKKWLLLLLFAQPLLAQETTQDATRIQPFFYNAMPMVPTPMHQYVYKQMENCSGQTGDFDNILWLTSPFIMRGPDHPQVLLNNEQFDIMRERRIYGLWWRSVAPNGDTIQVIMLDRINQFNPALVSHESLHSLYHGEIPLDVQERCLIL